jgi:hypothetical protein
MFGQVGIILAIFKNKYIVKITDRVHKYNYSFEEYELELLSKSSEEFADLWEKNSK